MTFARWMLRQDTSEHRDRLPAFRIGSGRARKLFGCRRNQRDDRFGGLSAQTAFPARPPSAAFPARVRGARAATGFKSQMIPPASECRLPQNSPQPRQV